MFTSLTIIDPDFQYCRQETTEADSLHIRSKMLLRSCWLVLSLTRKKSGMLHFPNISPVSKVYYPKTQITKTIKRKFIFYEFKPTDKFCARGNNRSFEVVDKHAVLLIKKYFPSQGSNRFLYPEL